MALTITGNIVDPIQEKVYPGTITVSDAKISKIEVLDSVPDGSPFILPGFVDSHIHIESTLMVPENYARVAVSKGTVACVTDPHEIANVLGVPGIDFMIRSASKVRFNFSFGIPSCVPSTPFETAGAVLGSDDIKTLLARDEFYGLAELMNFPGVLYGDPEVAAKIRYTVEAGKLIDGHAPGVSGQDARKYIDAGISTDHEISDVESARERLAMGMMIQIREGSAACSFDTLCPLLAENEWRDLLMFCSDDKYADEMRVNYIDDMVRRAVAAGMPLWNVLRAACVNAVRHYGLKTGLLQLGDSADFILADNLSDFNVLETYIGGCKVADADGWTSGLVLDDSPVEAPYPNKFLAQPLSADDIKVRKTASNIKVMVCFDGSLFTDSILAPAVADGDGYISTDVENDILKLVVYNRYAPAAPAVGFIRGFKLIQGAIASTIAHDSHNIVAVGTNDEDIVKAVNSLVEQKGGLCVVCDGVAQTLPLPVAGLMSPLSGEEVSRMHSALKASARRIGCELNGPFMTMAFMSLPVIPRLKLIDTGLFDVEKFAFTELQTN